MANQRRWRSLIARYTPGFAFISRSWPLTRVADDLLQDVWIDVFTNVARLQETAAFCGWVYRIARDKAYRDLRRRRVPTVAIEESRRLRRRKRRPGLDIRRYRSRCVRHWIGGPPDHR